MAEVSAKGEPRIPFTSDHLSSSPRVSISPKLVIRTSPRIFMERGGGSPNRRPRSQLLQLISPHLSRHNPQNTPAKESDGKVAIPFPQSRHDGLSRWMARQNSHKKGSLAVSSSLLSKTTVSSSSASFAAYVSLTNFNYDTFCPSSSA